VGPTVTGSGKLAAWDFDYRDFTKIEAGYAFDIEIVKADSYLVRITVDDNLYEYLDVSKRGDTLNIGLKWNNNYMNITRKATINLPDLEKLGLSGASKAKVDGFSSSHAADFELSGASNADISSMKAGNANYKLSGASKVSGNIEMADGRFNLSGASSIELEGSANDIDIEASGASHVGLSDFSVVDAEINLSGASNATINASGRLDGDLSGGSRLIYIGNPTLGSISASGGSTISKDEHAETRAALQNLIDQQVKEQDILGMAIAVRLADGTVIGKASGYSDPSGEEAWSVDTVSALGSVTKTFTAVVVMQLVEEGKLSLDDTIDTWFPEQSNGNRITIRMLLSHTSGIANYISGENVMEGKWNKEWAPMDLVAEANKSGPVGEPGSSEAHYSNTNYVLLGLIVEDITGNSWAQEVESRIIKPLDLKDTTFISNEGVWGGIMVNGYAKTPDGYISSLELPWYPHASTVWSAGEVVSTVSDLMTFASALFDGKLVSRETLAVMAQPLGTGVDRGLLWGLGGLQIEPGAFGMGGDIPGYHAFFMGYLDNKLIVTALINTVGDVITPSISALQYISQ